MKKYTASIFIFTCVIVVLVSGIANFRRIIFAGNSPFLDATAQRHLEDYAGFEAKKAFASSVTLSDWGWSYEYDDPAEASASALAYCEARQVKCLLYAVGDDIVWDAERARAERISILSSTRETGAVWRYYGEENPHGVDVSLSAGAPSIISDYRSERGILGGLRRLRAETPSRHQGIDIIGPIGTPVLAAADGVVTGAGFDEVAGKYVWVSHGGLGGTHLATKYIHLDSIEVSVGKVVLRGQRIGALGATGSGTTIQRPHLHFETEDDNPHDYWHDGPGEVTCFDPGRNYAGGQTALTYPVPCKAKN